MKQLGVPDESQVSLETYNQQYLQKHTTSDRRNASGGENGQAVVACAKAMQILGAPQSEIEELLVGTVVNLREGFTIELALEILGVLKTSGSERVEEFREGCRHRFVRSTVFGTVEEIAKLKEGVLMPADTQQTQKDDVLL